MTGQAECAEARFHGNPFRYCSCGWAEEKATPARSTIMRYFEFGHLPEGPLRAASLLFAHLAREVDSMLPDGAEKSTALRKLLEAKDAAVRAALDVPKESE